MTKKELKYRFWKVTGRLSTVDKCIFNIKCICATMLAYL